MAHTLKIIGQTARDDQPPAASAETMRRDRPVLSTGLRSKCDAPHWDDQSWQPSLLLTTASSQPFGCQGFQGERIRGFIRGGRPKVAFGADAVRLVLTDAIVEMGRVSARRPVNESSVCAEGTTVLIEARSIDVERDLVCPEEIARPSNRDVRKLVELLIGHLREMTPFSTYAEALSLALIAALRRMPKARAQYASAPTKYHDRLSRAAAFIEENLDKGLKVGDIADRANMSPGHFARIFKAAFGETVWAYMIRQRCERAKGLLEDEQLSLAEIAHRCGFSSQGHMTSAFRKSYGLTPGSFRAASWR